MVGIRRKKGTKVSCELVINELAYNAKEKYLELIDFYFGGTTLLGSDEEGNEINEGMVGSRADISEFCLEEKTYAFQEEIIEMQEKLNKIISCFNINNSKKGGISMNHFEELLAKYSVTAEDITFECEGMSDEELDAKFVKEAKAAGFENLKGHRSVGGMRASIYNAMPQEGVEALVAFMKKFEEENL